MQPHGNGNTPEKSGQTPANGDRDGTDTSTKSTPAQERARYLRQLYLLLGLIAILLIVISLLVPDRRASRADGAENGDHSLDDPAPAPRPEPEYDYLPDPPESDREPAEPVPEVEAGVVYFVLDDAGYAISELDRFLEIDVPMTVSVLPHLPYSGEAARAAAGAGHDVILHLPMEPANDADPGPGAIMLGHSRDEVRRRLESALASVPGAIGANNHMGSAATADEEIVHEVLTSLSGKGLFFLDSYTTVESTVGEIASELSLPAMQRTIFVDHDIDPDSMRAAFDRGIEHAVTHGAAILIGHVQTEALPPLLAEAAGEAEQLGIRFEGLAHYRDTRFPPDNPISRAMNEGARR